MMDDEKIMDLSSKEIHAWEMRIRDVFSSDKGIEYLIANSEAGATAEIGDERLQEYIRELGIEINAATGRILVKHEGERILPSTSFYVEIRALCIQLALTLHGLDHFNEWVDNRVREEESK